MVRVVPAAVLLLLILAVIVSWVAKVVMLHQARERLNQQALSLAHATQIKLDTLRDATQAIAANQLLVSGLIDTVERANYLTTFFHSLRLPGPTEAAISLTDYRGRTIASTNRSVSYEDALWLAGVMDDNEHFDLSSKGIIIAIPVKQVGMPEGAVVVEYHADNVRKYLQVSSTVHAAAIVDHNGTVLHSTEPAFVATGRFMPDHIGSEWIEARTTVPEYPQLDVVVAIPIGAVEGSLAKFDWFLIIGLIVGLFMVVAWTLFAGRMMMVRSPIGQWWLAATVATGAIVVTGFLCVAETRQETQHLNRVLANVNHSIASNIRIHLQYHIQALQRMAKRWSVTGRPEREAWEQDAASYVDHFGAIQAIEWVDDSYHVQWIVPLAGNEQAQDLNLACEPHRRATLEAAKESHDVAMTHAIDLVQGGKGFLVYCPIYHDSKFEGFILGVFHFDKLFEHLDVSGDWRKYQPRIKMGEQWVWEKNQNHAYDQGIPGTGHQESLTLYGVPWTIDLAASPHLAAETQSPLKILTLTIGGAIGILLVIMTRQAQILRWRAVEMADANRKLESEAAERERAQAKLSRSEELFRKTIESSASGMIMVDREGIITLVNAQTEVMFGYTREELVAQKMERLIPFAIPEAHVGCRAAFCGSPDSGAMGKNRDLSGRRKDGTQFPIEISLNSLETADGVQVLATVVDITQRKHHEQLLRHHMDELTRANKDLDDFAYVASHDLRSPLEGINKLAKWVREDNADLLPDRSKRHLEQMQQRIGRVESLLDDLLQYARAGRLDHDASAVDTGQLARDIAELGDRPSEFTVSVAPDMPTLVTAKPPLEQVLRNLISNAIKHHDCSDGTVKVSCQPNGQFVEFEISDDGPGINPQFHDQIFKMFTTLKPRDEVEGSGMGLAIIKKLVERYGGKITVTSDNGRGTTFRFTWPNTMNGDA